MQFFGLPKSMNVKILFMDESRFGKISDQRRCLGPLPERPEVTQQVLGESVFTKAAVNPFDGRLSSLIMLQIKMYPMHIIWSITAEVRLNMLLIKK